MGGVGGGGDTGYRGKCMIFVWEQRGKYIILMSKYKVESCFKVHGKVT